LKFAQDTASRPASFAPTMRCSSAGRTKNSQLQRRSNLELSPTSHFEQSQRRLDLANPGGLTYHPPAFYDPTPSRGVYEIIHACFIGVYCPVWKQ
jgi:hypothetical protein